MDEAISISDLRTFAESFRGDRANIVAMNAVTGSGLQAAARRAEAVRGDIRQYSLELGQHGITWQKNSGRCWMFAGFNVLREKLIQDLGLENFTFSGSYLMFYDKLEKANLYLESVIEMPDMPLDSREIEKLSRIINTDGGEWEMFASLVKKYGVVPAEVQPETPATEDSKTFAPLLKEKILTFARDLRAGYAAGRTREQLRQDKRAMLAAVYRMLSICCGEPVRTFDFQARGRDGAFICDRGLTPRQFYDKYIGVDTDEYISLVSGSSGGSELKKYEFEYKYLGDVIEGRAVDYVSVPVETLKAAAIAQMQAGQPVWFGCDVGESSWREGGLLDERLYDYRAIFNVSPRMSRRERFVYGQAHMSHAMVFKGVDLDENGRPLRWRVENTWGSDVGDRGMFLMTDGWFDRYTYQVVVNRRFVPAEVLAVYDGTDSEVLKPWIPHI